MKISDFATSSKQLILLITFLIAFYVLLEEIYNLTKFVFKYNYSYNYGKLLHELCGKDFTEFETSRFQIYKDINNVKIDNDLYNKNFYYLFILIITIIICIIISFGFIIFFYYIFCNNCITIGELDDDNSLKTFLKCMQLDTIFENVPSCIISYIILIILLLLPINYLIKYVFNYDLIPVKSKYIFILYIILFIYGLPFLTSYTRPSNNDEIKYNPYVYYILLISVILLTYLYRDIYNCYNTFTLIAEDLKTDEDFYAIYNSDEPKKPVKPTFDILNQAKINEKSTDEKKQYDIELKTYKKKLESYEKDILIYNKRLEIYNNTKIDDPEIIDPFTVILKKIIGLNLKTDLDKILVNVLVFLISIVILYYVLRYFKKLDNYGNYLYNILIIPILNLFLILLIINTVMVYNTYINKYIIYEPLSLYKNHLYNFNETFQEKKLNTNASDIYTLSLSSNTYIAKTNLTPNQYDTHTKMSIILNILTAMFKYNIIENNYDTSNPIMQYYQVNDAITTSPKYIKYTYNSSKNKYDDIEEPLTNIQNLLIINTQNIIDNNTLNDNNKITKFIKNIFLKNSNDTNIIRTKIYNNILETIYKKENKINYRDRNATNESIKNILYNTSLIEKIKVINECVEEYIKFLENFRKIIIDDIITELTDCITTDTIDINKKLDDISKLPTNNNIYTYITSTKPEIKNNINLKFKQLWQKIFIRLDYKQEETQDSVFDEIKKNYNIVNDEKYINNSFIKQTKYTLIDDNKDSEIITKNATTVSFSVILVISIFGIVLSEPLFINS